MLSRRTFLTAVSAALLAPSLRAGAAEATGGPAFGSRWTAVLGEGTGAETVRRIVRRIVAETDAVFSPYRADSALSRFNRSRSTGWQAVPRELADILAESRRLHDLSHGAFDPTVGPILARFGFGPIQGQAGGFGDVAHSDGRLRKTDPKLTLDFCGMAKGDALDRMIAALQAEGVRNLMLELGGEIRTLGTHPDGRDWQIGIERPLSGQARVHRVVAPHGRAVATSGHAAQSYPGASHLIDARSGRPADRRLASVTVLADTARRADALATTLAALGPDDGPGFAAGHDVTALFVLNDGDRLTDRMTGGFAAHVLT